MKTSLIQLRVTPQVKTILERIAVDNNVSLTRLVELALSDKFTELKEELPKL